MDTIFAQATAVGRAGVSIVRISGPSALQVCAEMAGSLPVARFAGLRKLQSVDGGFIDEALVLCFPGPNSFTGEDVVEFHLHGSIAILRRVMDDLLSFDAVRIADPGEFTRRALENGRLDLTQVEGLADLIDAETEAQRKQALRVLSGELGGKVDGWRDALIRASALLAATIDFADEDVPTDVSVEVREALSPLQEDLRREIRGSLAAERVRLGFEVAIIGAPNVGKSTLLNRIAGRDAAITSSIAGTTRDVIEVRMDLNGLPVTILDTAGIRESDDEIETMGINRALERAEEADLRIFLVEEDGAPVRVPEAIDIVVYAKGDLTGARYPSISGRTGAGVSEMLCVVEHRLNKIAGQIGVATHLRHADAMKAALIEIDTAFDLLQDGPASYDFIAEHLRAAVHRLSILMGRVGVENLLDEIFSSFCLGK